MRIIPLSTLLLAGCLVDAGTPVDVSTADQPIANGTSTDIGRTIRISSFSDCTASVLNDRWLLTAGSCITSEIYGSFFNTLTNQVYYGRVLQFEHPSHVGSDDDPVHDIGLIYLEDYGISATFAEIFTDTRRPWCDASEPDDMWLEGWGQGGDNCEYLGHSLTHGALHVDYNPGNTHYASAAKGSVHACPGDRGGEYYLYRGTDSDARYLQFAVHSGLRPTWIPFNPTPTIRHQGALLEDSFGWIATVISERTSGVFGTRWVNGTHGGFASQRSEIVERPLGNLVGFNNRCMHDTMTTPDRVEMRACDSSTNQLWRFTKLGEIRRSSGLLRESFCLEMTDNSTANRTVMRVARCNGSLAQRFVFTSGGQIQPAIARSKCVEAPGSVVQLYDCNGSPPQMWLP